MREVAYFLPQPFEIDTSEPIEPPWQAIKERIPEDKADPGWFDYPPPNGDHLDHASCKPAPIPLTLSARQHW